MKMNKRKLAILAVAAMMTAAVFIPVAGSADSVPDKRTEIGFYLDTIITLTAYVDDPQILKDAMTDCGRKRRMADQPRERRTGGSIGRHGGDPPVRQGDQ